MADTAHLLDEIDGLIDHVASEAARALAEWEQWGIRAEFRESAANLAAYLALRHRDLRDLQRGLMPLGLSSLGRLESRVEPSLQAVRAALAGTLGLPHGPSDPAAFFAGEDRLRQRTAALFGPKRHDRPVALLVTVPSSAADDPAFMLRLARRGVEAVRINCAHDGPKQWARMIDHVRAAEAVTGHRMRIMMDLAGPKLRTGEVVSLNHAKRVFPGDRIAIVPEGQLERKLPADIAFACECTLPAAIAQARAGQRLLIDDGLIVTRIDLIDGDCAIVHVTGCKEEGAKLKSEKGINLPDAEIDLPALTEQDRADLEFVVEHADGIEFSFVQDPEDVALLQGELARLDPEGWTRLALVLKIETARAIRNLPDIIVRAGCRQPVAVMIARGDLANEIGFERLAEMQEEILWIAEAAQVPLIWATQVLESMVKDGMPTRGELTDAAMAARAECVMLNKGAYLFEAIDALELLLGRMDAHVHKKTPQLRRLTTW